MTVADPAPRQWSRRGLWRAVGSALIAISLLMAFFNPPLLLFAAAGLAIGWWLRAFRRRPRKTFDTTFNVSVVVLTIAICSFFVWALFNMCISCGRPPVDYVSVRANSELVFDDDASQWRINDELVFDAADVASVGRKIAAEGVSLPEPDLTEHLDNMELKSLEDVLTKELNDAGWTFAGTVDGQPRFGQSRKYDVDIPWWPLSTTSDVAVVSVELLGGFLVLTPDKDSIARITAPERLIRSVFPQQKSREPILQDDREQLVVGFESLPDGIRFELASPLARHELTATLLDLSLSTTLRWFLLIVLAVFKEQVTDVVKTVFVALGRRLRLKSRPAGKVEG